MDYMQELASHPDMPQALNALRLHWQELFAPAAAGKDRLKDLTERWNKLFGGPRPVPASVEEFDALKSRWQVTSQLVEKGLADAHQNAAGVEWLIEGHPNVWIAQVVHEFYKLPGLAADAWLELGYCDRFRGQLAKRILAQAGQGWFVGEAAHQEARSTARKIVDREAPVKKASPMDDKESEREHVRHASARVGLVHEPPQFIKDLIDRKAPTDKWFTRTPPPGGVSPAQLAYS